MPSIPQHARADVGPSLLKDPFELLRTRRTEIGCDSWKALQGAIDTAIRPVASTTYVVPTLQLIGTFGRSRSIINQSAGDMFGFKRRDGSYWIKPLDLMTTRLGLAGVSGIVRKSRSVGVVELITRPPRTVFTCFWLIFLAQIGFLVLLSVAIAYGDWGLMFGGLFGVALMGFSLILMLSEHRGLRRYREDLMLNWITARIKQSSDIGTSG